jgi:hypothetical protein
MGHYKSDFQEKKSEDAEGEDSQEVCQFIQATALMTQTRALND